MSTNQLAKCTDWEVIQQEYIQGGDEVTCEVLAINHGVHKTTVKKHCANHGWTTKRFRFRYQTATLIEKRTKEELAEVRVARARSIEEKLYNSFNNMLYELDSLPPGKEKLAATHALVAILEQYRKQVGGEANEAEQGEKITIERWRHLKCDEQP